LFLNPAAVGISQGSIRFINQVAVIQTSVKVHGLSWYQGRDVDAFFVSCESWQACLNQKIESTEFC